MGEEKSAGSPLPPSCAILTRELGYWIALNAASHLAPRLYAAKDSIVRIQTKGRSSYQGNCDFDVRLSLNVL